MCIRDSGPADRAGKSPQAILVNLPDKTVTTDYNTPISGAFAWWGGSAANLNTTLTRTVDLSAATASATLSSWAKYDIEADYDYLYGEVSTDDGLTWVQVGTPIDGVSGGAVDADGLPDYGNSVWTELPSYDLSAYKGQTVQFRFRYATDGGLHFDGPFLDDLALTVDGVQTFADDVESGDNGWTADGFTLSLIHI